MTRFGLTMLFACLGFVLTLTSMSVGYNLYTSAKNRELYVECLKMVERIAKEADRNSLVSTPNCYLR